MNRKDLYKKLTKQTRLNLHKPLVKDFSTRLDIVLPMLIIDISVLGSVTVKEFIDIWRQTGITMRNE